jgi:hypothetical protein
MLCRFESPEKTMAITGFIYPHFDTTELAALAADLQTIGVEKNKVTSLIRLVDEVLATEDALYSPSRREDDEMRGRLETLHSASMKFSRSLSGLSDNMLGLIRQQRLTKAAARNANLVSLESDTGEPPNGAFSDLVAKAHAIEVYTGQIINRQKAEQSNAVIKRRRSKRTPSDEVIVGVGRAYLEVFGSKPSCVKNSEFSKIIDAIGHIKKWPSVGPDRLNALLSNLRGPKPKRGRKPRP